MCSFTVFFCAVACLVVKNTINHFLSGAAVGLVSSFFFLSLFVETDIQTSLSMKDTLWVGNWWLGFLVVAALGALGSPWMFGFPNELPTTKARREQNEYKEDVGYEEHL